MAHLHQKRKSDKISSSICAFLVDNGVCGSRLHLNRQFADEKKLVKLTCKMLWEFVHSHKSIQRFCDVLYMKTDVSYFLFPKNWKSIRKSM